MQTGQEYITGMSIDGVARALGADYHHVRYLIVRARRLKAVRDGTTWLVDPLSVRSYKAELEAKKAEGSTL